MWKFIHKGFKCGKSAKVSYVVVCPDDVQTSPSSNSPLSVRQHLSSRALPSNQYHSSYGDSGGGNFHDDPDHEWKRRFNIFDCDIWFHHNCYHFLQAVGWGSAVITGFQITDLCHRSHGPSFGAESKCWFRSLVSNAPAISWSRINDLLSNYSVALLSRTLSDKILTAKSILPASVQHSIASLSNNGSSASVHENTVDDVVSTEDQQKHFDSDHDVSVNLCHSFSLHDTPSVSSDKSPTSTTESLSSGDLWYRLIDDHLAAVRCNAEALEMVRRGQFTAAVKIWSESCSKPVHSPQSLFNLAVCYHHGIAVDKDVDKAVDLYSKAADLGHGKSAFNLAVIFLDKSSSKECTKQAIDLLEKASDLGLKEAQRELGVLYTEHPRRDMVQAVRLFEKASIQKDALAMYFLGICYEHGWGVAKNEVKAAGLYKSAGSLGHADALHNMGVFFENGLGGLPQDKYEAIRYFRAASAAGNVQATDRLNILKKQHPLLTAIVADGKDNIRLMRHVSSDSPPVTVSGGPSWTPVSRLFSFSSSTDSETDEDNGSGYSMASDTSTSCGGSKSTWQIKPTSLRSLSLLYDHSSAVKASLPDGGGKLTVDDMCGDLRHLDELVDHMMPARSLESIHLLRNGAFGKAALPHVSSFG